MVPYYPEPVFRVGPLMVHAFSLLMIAAILMARWSILQRSRRLGLDRERMARLCVWMLLAGLVGADLLKTIGNNLQLFAQHPAFIFFTSHGIASLGGLGGGLIGGLLWCRLHRVSGPESLRMLDAIAYALPLAWVFGRFGCTLAHDHPGLFTRSWIAVRFPEGPRFDLGLIEFLFLIVMAAGFGLLDRRPRPAGFFFGLFGMVYGLFRIWLDTLHIQEFRFLGGLWSCLIGLTGWILMAYLLRKERALVTADAEPRILHAG